jgi:hypothetical protein
MANKLSLNARSFKCLDLDLTSLVRIRLLQRDYTASNLMRALP